MTRSRCAIALIASACPAVAASGQDRTSRIDVPAGTLVDALTGLAVRTGASIGTDVALGGRTSPAVHGRMDVGEALRRLLARSDLAPRRVGPATWRLVRRLPAVRVEETAGVPDVVVTGRKLTEPLSRVPGAIAVYRTGGAERPDDARTDAHDVAAAVEGLSMTNLGPGRDRPFIRGIADSPFNGFSQTTVSVVVDDARVTYDAPEPGLRLVDVARVEVMKGPQGPLYGTGALGGVYRIVTNRPVLGEARVFATYGLDLVRGDRPGADASLMLNAPLVGDAAAVRLVGYAVAQGGWVTNAGGRSGVNDSFLAGSRAAVRVVPASGWTVDLGAAFQRDVERDSQYVDRYAEDLTRSGRIAEPAEGSFRLLSSTVEGPVGSLRLTVASSQAWQDRQETYAASASAAMLGFAGARSYVDRRSHRVFDQEVRLASTPASGSSWVAGASYLSATTFATGELAGPDAVRLPYFLLHRAISEAALFADASLPLTGRLRVGAGGRLFRATTDDERREEPGTNAVKARAKVGFTPSASLTYALAPERLVYLRFGSAFRPGGLDPANPATGRYDADEVRSAELGTRLLLAGDRLSLSAAAFGSTWANVQSDYLEANGLVATRTAGDALVLGVELSAEWRSRRWWVRAGGLAQRARLVSDAAGAVPAGDRRLPVVPDGTARLEAGRTVDVAGRRGEVHAAIRYLGRSRLSFDPGLDRGMGGYATLEAGVSLAVGGIRLRIDASNLLDARADTFAFGNPFMIRSEHEYTPLRPRAFRIGVSRAF